MARPVAYKPILFLGALLCAAGLIFSSLVHTDVGDGAEACNPGEICFHHQPHGGTLRKHFWWDAQHAGYAWWDAQRNIYLGPIQNDAGGLRNRDSICPVAVIDGSTTVINIIIIPNDHQHHNLGAAVQYRNDRHIRCYGGPLDTPGGP